MIQGFGTFVGDGAAHLGFRAGDLVVDLGEGSLDELLSQGAPRGSARPSRLWLRPRRATRRRWSR